MNITIAIENLEAAEDCAKEILEHIKAIKELQAKMGWKDLSK